MPRWPREIDVNDYSMNITFLSPCSSQAQVSGTIAASTWPVANRAYLIPFRIGRTMVVANAFVGNGAAVNGNFDIGVYDEDATLRGSTGAVAQAGVSIVQSVALALTLGPGSYYIALAFDNIVAQVYRSVPNVYVAQPHGYIYMNNSYPLPAVGTFLSITGGTTCVPLAGITTRSFV